MEYWIRSISPLVIRKAYISTTAEVMEWVDYVIEASIKMYEEKGQIFPLKKEDDIFKECFVLLKVDTDKHPALKKIFGTDSESKKWLSKRKIRIPNVEEAWHAIASVEVKKLGRPRKIKSDPIKKKIINAMKSKSRKSKK